MAEAVIVAAKRSPIGRAFKGSLVAARPDDLGAQVVQAALATVPQLGGIPVDDLICGCGLPGGQQGFNMGRVISLLSHLDCPGTTITRYCASSLQAMRMAFHAIHANEGDLFVVAGVESVSSYMQGSSDMPQCQNPRFAKDNEEKLPDIYIAMGETAENVVTKEKVTRDEMDRFALRSQERAVAAQDSGFFAREIVEVSPAHGQDPSVSVDDGPRRGTSLEKLASLAPAFRPDGQVTAGNACPLNDGAAAVIVMSDTKAKELGITPLARIVSTGMTALNPEYMGLGPIEASRQALARAGKKISDIDIVEINEAFAAQVLPSAKALGIDPFGEQLNPHGGAIALGHPFGMTGARIMCTLLNGLTTRNQSWGLETMCVGGGMGMAMVVERLS